MVIFFLVAVALALLVLILIVPPLFRGQPGEAEDRNEQNLIIAREQLAELDARRERGELDDAAYQREREDIEGSLLDDLVHSDAVAATGRPAYGPGVAVAVLVPVIAGSLYLGLGRPEALSPAPGVATAPGAEGHATDLAAMVDQLAARMEQHPDNAEGWAMLARSYMAMQRYTEAVQAYEKLRRLAGDQPGILVRHADALAMSQGGALQGEPERLVQRALELQPDNAQGLWMAGTAANQAGDYPRALAYWRKLEPMLTDQPEPLAQLRSLIARTEQRSEEPAPATNTTSTGDDAKSVTVEVTVDDSLRDRIQPGDAVFIFARALEGPPMPLAVVRKKVSDLPVTVTLDDSTAMAPALRLSNFEQVRVGARVSKSGQAVSRSGDLRAQATAVTLASDEHVRLNIDQVVP